MWLAGLRRDAFESQRVRQRRRENREARVAHAILTDRRQAMNRKEFLRTVAAGAAGTLAGGAPARGAQAPSSNSGKVIGDALKGSTRAVVDFVTTARFESFPPDVIAQAKRCLIDGFAMILAGSTVEGSEIVRHYVRSISKESGARIDPRTGADAGSPRCTRRSRTALPGTRWISTTRNCRRRPIAPTDC